MSDEEPNCENAGRLIADSIAALVLIAPTIGHDVERTLDAAARQARTDLARGLKMALVLLTKEGR